MFEEKLSQSDKTMSDLFLKNNNYANHEEDRKSSDQNNQTEYTVKSEQTESEVVSAEKENTRPDVIKKIDDLIALREPYLVAKMREIRRDGGLVFQGYTRDEIDAKFKIEITGQESYNELRVKIADLNSLYIEANRYLRDIELELNATNAYMEHIKVQLDQEIIISNLSAKNTKEKISDKAREALVARVYRVADTGERMAEVSTELALWKSIVFDLHRTFERIQQNMQALASEHKYSTNSSWPSQSRPAVGGTQ